MNTRDIINIFNKYDIYTPPNKTNIKISSLGGITNTNFKVEMEEKAYVLRVPGDNPDLISREAEKYNHELIMDTEISLPFIIFDEDTGIKISEFYENLYTFTAKDMKNKKYRNDALNLLLKLHDLDLNFKNNFSPLGAYEKLALLEDRTEHEVKEIAEAVIFKLYDIGLESKPCHQDLYHANFVYKNDKTYLIDWEYSSQGDPYFDFADFIWQNELNENSEIINDIYKVIGVSNKSNEQKMKLFSILSMITWGLWAKRRAYQSSRGQETLRLAIKMYEDNFL